VAEPDIHAIGLDVLHDVIATFDGRILPVAAQTIGQARDVDGDGRFTILMSSWLARLANGRHAVDGFIKGADFDMELSAPFSNHADMMYLTGSLKPGPYLHTLLAHEYAHAVTVSSKALGQPSTGRLGPEEEGWLDEALAHLAEDLHGFSRSNLDYRISAFLSQPERYRLVVEDYYTADLFRSHGNRGGTYLFLRWCADRYGSSLLPTLIHSHRRGTANLEAATGSSFSDLYRDWSVMLFLSGLDPRAKLTGSFRSLDIRGTCEGWELAGPRSFPLTPGGPDQTWAAVGTSSHFTVVGASESGAVAIDVSGPPEAELQVTAVALPTDLPRLDLSARTIADARGNLALRALVSEHDGLAVMLSALAWEPLVPATDPHAAGSGPRRGGLDTAGIRSTFGSAELAAGRCLESQPIPLAGIPRSAGPLIVKAEAIDAEGRRVAAWAEVPLAPQPAPGRVPAAIVGP
jgi:hypothetical protein